VNGSYALSCNPSPADELERQVPGDSMQEVVMSADSFPEFETDALAEGFDEVIERKWDPGVTLDTHVHPFALKALVVAGEMWLTVGDQTRHLRAGDSFALESSVPHAERYGAEGATYWVARRHG
jgi:quercetin dioxygenase-like cupin family protein